MGDQHNFRHVRGTGADKSMRVIYAGEESRLVAIKVAVPDSSNDPVNDCIVLFGASPHAEFVLSPGELTYLNSRFIAVKANSPGVTRGVFQLLPR